MIGREVSVCLAFGMALFAFGKVFSSCQSPLVQRRAFLKNIFNFDILKAKSMDTFRKRNEDREGIQRPSQKRHQKLL